MYALRIMLGLVLVLAQGGFLLWSAFDAPVHASDVSVENGKYVQVITSEHPLDAAGQVSVQNSNGAIEVRSWDKDAVRVVATKEMKVGKGLLGWFGGGNPFKDEAAAMAYFEELRVDVASEPDHLEAQSVYPKDRKSGVNLSVSYVIDAPKSARLDLKSSNGPIRVTEMDGSVLADTSNAPISIRDVLGEVNADTSNGPVNLSNVSGGVHVETSNGPVQCENAAGPVSIRTSNGPVQLSATAPLKPEQIIECHTSNGAIKLELPKNSAFNLAAKTSQGSIRSDFALPTHSEREPRTEVTAAINGGGPEVELRTSNGGISIIAK